MAQIYPEDRGTNYAIREGRRVARDLAARFAAPSTRAETGEDRPDRARDDQHVDPE